MTRAQLSARLLAPLAWLLRKCGWLCVEPIEPYRSKSMFEDVRICPETGAPIIYVDAGRMRQFGRMSADKSTVYADGKPYSKHEWTVADHD